MRGPFPHAAVAVAAAAGAVGAVWFFGFDWWWSIAAVAAVGATGGAIAGLGFGGPAPWEPPPRDTPRSTRLAVVTIEQALAACERLARPEAWQRLRALHTSERLDRRDREALLRQLRALNNPEVNARLEPYTEASPSTPIPVAVIEHCLDAIESPVTATPEPS